MQIATTDPAALGGIRATAEQLAPRAHMQTVIANLVESYRELAKAKRYIARLTGYGRNTT